MVGLFLLVVASSGAAGDEAERAADGAFTLFGEIFQRLGNEPPGQPTERPATVP